MPVVTYSVLRLGLLVVALVGLWLAGMGGWLLVLVAALVAGALSYVVLGKQRDAAALWLADLRRRPPRRDDDAAAEDAQIAAAEQVAGPADQSARPRPSSKP